MNTLARSLDALLGPSIKKRGRKRDIAPVEGGDDGRDITPQVSRKRRRITTAAGDDAGYEQSVSTSVISSSATALRKANQADETTSRKATASESPQLQSIGILYTSANNQLIDNRDSEVCEGSRYDSRSAQDSCLRRRPRSRLGR